MYIKWTFLFVKENKILFRKGIICKMSTLASQSLGGFYKTPLEVLKHVCNKLKIEEGSLFNILDTCAGEGEALRFIQDSLEKQGGKICSFGNELEKSRYEKAKKILNHTVHGGYESLRTSPFHSFWWGNPPYDNGYLERMEVSAFRLHTYKNEKQILQRGALVCFCVKQKVLSDLAEIVSSRLDGIRVYRFTDEHYPRFQQVIIFGYFNKPNMKNRLEIKKYLQEVAILGPEALPPIDIPDNITFSIPPSLNKIDYFRGDRLKNTELWEDLQQSAVFDEIEHLFLPTGLKEDSKLKRPILPLKPAHMALVLTANAIDGNMGDFWVNGYTKIEKEKKIIENDDGKPVREEITSKPIPLARIFHPHYGIVELK
ncbi:DUF6094 domain-containing protein [Brevibacillus halotolerans]|nr:DUF6094 domain-containing protein [Brevibacillus halotolerans]